MSKNKIQKIIYIIPLLILAQLFSLIQYREVEKVTACTTASECKSEIDNAKKKRSQLQDEQKKLEAESADVQTQLVNVVKQLEAYQEEATALTIELAQLKDQQVKLKASITENDKKIRKRLLDTQLSIENNVSLQFIANSSSITELIERLQAVHDLSQTDRNLIQTLSEQIKVLEENEKAQQERQIELETLMKESEKLQQTKKADLDKYSAEVQAKLNDQQTETNKIKLSENQLNEIETARKAAEAAAAAEAARQRELEASQGNKPIIPSEVPTEPIPSNGTPVQNERAAFKYFVSLGYTREAAAGIIGNFYVESGMDPTKKQYGGGGGRGLAQWGYNVDGGRFNQLVSWARSQNRSEWALDTQLEWTAKEIRSYRMVSTLSSTHDVIYATKYFCDVFERPDPKYVHMDQRYGHAQSVLSRN